MFEGEFFGNIFMGKSIDLSRAKSKVALADSLTAKAVSSVLANLTAPVAFLRTAADGTDRYWALGGRLFKSTNTDPEAGWAQDAISSTPSAPLYDMIEFSASMLVAKDTNIDKLTAGTWTTDWWSSLSGASALQTGKPHRFGILAGALLITDGRYVNSYDGTIATDPDLTLPSQFDAMFILTTQDTSYIGTRSQNGGEAEVFSWDRANTNYTARYPVGDSECLAGFVAGGIPYVITKRGYILRFNGNGFGQPAFAQFPTVELQKDISNINPNGISVDGNVVKINVDFGVIADFRLRSGIWTLELDSHNLYHSGGIKNNASKDWSQSEVAAAGAIYLTRPTQGRYLVGGQAYTAYSSASVHGIYTFDEESSDNRGYIVTTKQKASDIRKFNKSITARFGNFLSSSDRIRAAYRTIDSTTLPAFETITWVTATTFTGTNANAAVGDFVEILAGDNAGALARITGKTGGPTYTFTIDVTLNASTAAARAMYIKFTDLGTISSQGIQERMFRPLARSNWIQYLFELRGGVRSPQLEEILGEGSDVPL